MKKLLLKTILGLSIFISTSSSSLQTLIVLANDTSPAHKSSYTKLKDLNSTLTQKISNLREHPQKYDKIAPDCKFHWFKYITNINFLKNHQLEIYVTPKFQTLSENARQDVIYHAQMFAFQAAEKSQRLSATQYREGLATVIFCDGEFLGHSQYLHNDELVWKK